MGEQPLFTTKAHVFHIDPATKKNWIPSSSGSVNVAFYYDTNRTAYRVISVEGSKVTSASHPIINSTVVPNMNFTKTSQKFGQWSDTRANTVYGLGFGSENELDMFAEKFAEIKELTKQPPTPQPSQPPPNFRKIENGSSDHADSVRHNDSHSSLPGVDYMNTGGDQRVKVGMTTAVDNTSQLKYENDRLKVALAQSSANAKKWEAELQTLKNNNARLTAGLQESNQNVEEWKKQLNAYKDDNAMLKKQLIEKEQQNSSQEVSKLQGEVYSALSQLNSTQNDKQTLEKELSTLRSKLQMLTSLEEKDRANENIIRELRSEIAELTSKFNSAKLEAERVRNSQCQDRSDLNTLRDTLSHCSTDLTSAQHVISRLLNS